jgi:hypothetical protein
VSIASALLFGSSAAMPLFNEHSCLRLFFLIHRYFRSIAHLLFTSRFPVQQYCNRPCNTIMSPSGVNTILCPRF